MQFHHLPARLRLAISVCLFVGYRHVLYSELKAWQCGIERISNQAGYVSAEPEHLLKSIFRKNI